MFLVAPVATLLHLHAAIFGLNTHLLNPTVSEVFHTDCVETRYEAWVNFALRRFK